MIDISVIIPFKNQFLDYMIQCINSVLVQIQASYEILVIDDYSDNQEVYNALLEYYSPYKDKVFFYKVSDYKSHGSVSIARNIGLSLAKGEYILFLDSDDFLTTPLAFSILLDAFKNSNETNLGIIQFNHYLLNENNRIPDKDRLLYIKDTKRANVEGYYKAITESNLEIENKYYSAVWCKIFKKQLLLDNKITFYEFSQIAEDTAFFTLCVNYMGIKNISNYFICHRKTNFSVSATLNKDKIINKIITLEFLKQDIANRQLPTVSLTRIDRYLKTAYNELENC